MQMDYRFTGPAFPNAEAFWERKMETALSMAVLNTASVQENRNTPRDPAPERPPTPPSYSSPDGRV